MPIPVINTTTSVLGYNQWQYFEYQPWASNTPTGWTSSALPPGLSFDTSTGLLSGAATSAGVYNIAIYAANGDGPSASLVITIGIDPASAGTANPGYNVNFDIVTREITVVGADTTTPVNQTAMPPGLFGKFGDDLLIYVTLTSGTNVLDPTVTGFKLCMKQSEDNPVLVLSDAFKQYGTGTGSYVAVHASLSGSLLEAAISDADLDVSDFFNALAEFELTIDNPLAADSVGGSTLTFRSKDFNLQIARNIAPTSA